MGSLKATECLIIWGNVRREERKSRLLLRTQSKFPGMPALQLLSNNRQAITSTRSGVLGIFSDCFFTNIFSLSDQQTEVLAISRHTTMHSMSWSYLCTDSRPSARLGSWHCCCPGESGGDLWPQRRGGAGGRLCADGNTAAYLLIKGAYDCHFAMHDDS